MIVSGRRGWLIKIVQDVRVLGVMESFQWLSIVGKI